MWHDGQIVSRDEVEPAVAEAYPHWDSFRVSLTERERPWRPEPDVHVTVRLTDNNGKAIVVDGKPIEYYSTRRFASMPQIAMEDVL